MLKKSKLFLLWAFVLTVLIIVPTANAEVVSAAEENAASVVMEEGVPIYAANGRMLFVDPSEVESYKNKGWFTSPVQRLYTEDGRTELFFKVDVEPQLAVGWYEFPVTRLYARDGRSQLFFNHEVLEQLTVGWYPEPFIKMYSLDGRTINVQETEVEAHQNVGWYLEPMTKLYASNGNTIIVPTKEVAAYRNVGWYPIHSFIFECPYEAAEMFFGPFKFIEYYEGVPNSGDLARTYYTNEWNDNINIPYLSYADNGYGTTLTLYLKDMFPYLKMYADEYGMVSIQDLNAALSDNGIYGLNYRENNGVGYFMSYSDINSYGDYYYFDYDHKGASVKKDGEGYVNIYTSTFYCDILS